MNLSVVRLGFTCCHSSKAQIYKGAITTDKSLSWKPNIGYWLDNDIYVDPFYIYMWGRQVGGPTKEILALKEALTKVNNSLTHLKSKVSNFCAFIKRDFFAACWK